MAPEQSKHKTVNDRTDIYNLGATMYRLTSGQLPPSTISVPNSPGMNAKLFRNLLKPVREFAPDAPPQLCDLIHCCLDYDPKKRPERAGDVLDELNALIGQLVQTDDDRLDTMEW